ncbi:MAG: GT99 family glycosyltransferase N-terminal domain-containing protein [Rhodanobacter sp.]
MFVSFLLPKIDRGAGPLYHWVMLAQMSRFRPDEIAFLGDAEYFDEAMVPFGETLQIGGFRFCCPEREQFARYRKICLDGTSLERLYDDGRSHLDVFRDVLREPQPVLVKCLQDALAELGEDVTSAMEAFLTWCNCPSLNEVARSLNVPVIHNELGPLRGPLYRDTVYFDFEGVNGGTSASRWKDTAWLREQMQGADLLDIDTMRGLLVQDVARARKASTSSDRFGLGVALQVQDDSNCIAYNRGWDELRLIYDALTRYRVDHVLIRAHPHARFLYRGGLGKVDDSRDSLEFLGKVDRVVAINSSLLVEAALWGVPFIAKGDSPAVCLAEDATGGRATGAERTLWMNAFFLAYLVPAEALFDPDYYRWRLAAPRSLGDCHRRHVGYLEALLRVQLPMLRGADETEALHSGLTRMPAAWTRSASLEGRIEHAEHKLGMLRHELDQAEGRYAQLQERFAAERAWRVEAEKLWDEHEWLRNRVGELERQLGQGLGELEAVRRERQELADKLQQEVQSRGELEAQLAGCTRNYHDMEGRLAMLNEHLRNLRLSLRDRVRGRLTHLPGGEGNR